MIYRRRTSSFHEPQLCHDPTTSPLRFSNPTSRARLHAYLQFVFNAISRGKSKTSASTSYIHRRKSLTRLFVSDKSRFFPLLSQVKPHDPVIRSTTLSLSICLSFVHAYSTLPLRPTTVGAGFGGFFRMFCCLNHEFLPLDGCRFMSCWSLFQGSTDVHTKPPVRGTSVRLLGEYKRQ